MPDYSRRKTRIERGNVFTAVLSTALSMMSIHPLNVATWKRARYASPTLSKDILKCYTHLGNF